MTIENLRQWRILIVYTKFLKEKVGQMNGYIFWFKGRETKVKGQKRVEEF